MKTNYISKIFRKEAVVLRYSVKKVFLEILQNSEKNICARVSFLIKLQASAKSLLLKKRLWHRCLPLNFVEFLTTIFLTEHIRWLLLLESLFKVYIIDKVTFMIWRNRNEFLNLAGFQRARNNRFQVRVKLTVLWKTFPLLFAASWETPKARGMTSLRIYWPQ